MSRIKKPAILILVVLVAAAILAVSFAACDGSGKVRVEFDCDGGTVGGVGTFSLNVDAGKDVDISDYVPVKNGYTFAGWTDGKTTDKGTLNVSSDVSLKA